MTLNIKFAAKPTKDTDTVIIGVYADNNLSTAADALHVDTANLIESFLGKQESFKGKSGQIITAPVLDEGKTRVLLVGLGDPDKIDGSAAETVGGKLFMALKSIGSKSAAFILGDNEEPENISTADMGAHIAMGVRLRGYSFLKYKTLDAEDESPELGTFTIAGKDNKKSAKTYEPLGHVAAGMLWARDLVNEPPNMLYPESFAKMIKDELKPLGVEVEIFDEKKLEKLGFKAQLAVGMGSARTPRTVVMRWNGKAASKKKSQPLAFVGKGVTFDTGGINIKPSAGMEDMKLDMGGAAAVVGLMKSLALRNAKADVVGIVGLAENMPSDRAYRPSDVIGSYSGKTIEVLNTDAEGRLVLADCLTYVQRKYDPALVVDLATLTGAMMIALGHEYCGTFVNDNDLWANMESASKSTGEKLWRMPLNAAFKKEMVSSIADVKSLGNGRYAGACTAAGFLEHFIEDNRPWAHMDIAGTAWVKSDSAICPKPGMGFGVRVLDKMIADHYEGK